MRYAALTAAAATLLAASSPLFAQEGAGAPASEDQVYVDVDGAAVQVPVALAAEACGMDETAVMEAAAARSHEGGHEASSTSNAAAPSAGGGAEGSSTEPASGSEAAATDESNETVTTAQGAADPSTAAPGDEMLSHAVCRIDVAKAGDLGIPQANEVVTD